jgi:NAD(P)-dependent dehydrogenase (short-subunit alcohol dehydrogenase family)
MFHDVIPENSEKMVQVAQSIPVKRLGRPADVSRAVAFFLAPENSFVTGQTLFVCGGASIGSLAL